MVKIMVKIKPRFLNFGYVIGMNMTTIYLNFQMNLQDSQKPMVKLI